MFADVLDKELIRNSYAHLKIHEDLHHCSISAQQTERDTFQKATHGVYAVT
jgi:hypothetical protein